ncbi:hypothetical protein VNO77_16999 [Canavalia gladiata]|uniref:Uncharacterized protein n=1 Tax=Canavalia gladiata TaxID=3824 RepID=A0AAN9LLX2_CANGL
MYVYIYDFSCYIRKTLLTTRSCSNETNEGELEETRFVHCSMSIMRLYSGCDINTVLEEKGDSTQHAWNQTNRVTGETNFGFHFIFSNQTSAESTLMQRRVRLTLPIP